MNNNINPYRFDIPPYNHPYLYSSVPEIELKYCKLLSIGNYRTGFKYTVIGYDKENKVPLLRKNY